MAACSAATLKPVAVRVRRKAEGMRSESGVVRVESRE
jgi:hypothetical protein